MPDILQVTQELGNVAPASDAEGLRSPAGQDTIRTMSAPLFRSARSAAVTLVLTVVGASGASAQTRGVAAKPGTAGAPQATVAAFTKQQAARGNKVFAASCLECHGRKDMSSADFRLKWNGRTVFDLYERIASTMPESNPGGLSAGEYADVVAYLLELNGMPAGARAVAAGPALRQQKLVMPPKG